MTVRSIFEKLCPNCGGSISDERLLEGLPCSKCLEKKVHDFKEIYEILMRKNKLKNWKYIYQINKETEDFSIFFKKATSFDLWSAQKTWFKRILLKKSFSIVAPTGVGKTVFTIISSLYFANKNKKAYIILPTTSLLKQVVEKINKFKENLKLNIKIVYYHSDLSKKEKEEFEKNLKNNDFGILITTSQYLARKFSLLKDKRFDLIFVDDVDALLRSSKNIDKVLILLGFENRDIKIAYDMVLTKIQALRNPRLREKIEFLRKELDKIKERRKHGILVIASATGSQKGLKPKIFRELLDFEVGSSHTTIRNIEDLYVRGDILEKTLEIIKIFGKGGIVFIPRDLKIEEFGKKVEEFLNSKGIKAKLVTSNNKEGLDLFIKGKIDILIGAANPYGILTRGIDLPDKIRYVVFAGVPKYKFSFKIEKDLDKLNVFLMLIDNFLPPEKLDLLKKFNEYMKELEIDEIRKIEEALREGKNLESKKLEKVKKFVEKVIDYLNTLINDPSFLKKIKESDIPLIEERGEKYILVPDLRTYIQASGRASRLFVGGISKGASIVIIDNEKVFRNLVRKTRWWDAEWKSLEEIDIKKLISEIDKDRELIKLAIEGKIIEKLKDPIKSVLFIVESPNKARTISSFFGKPGKRRIKEILVWEVTIGNYILTIVATMGHLFDLVTNKGFHGVIVDKNKFLPLYDSIKICKKCGYQFVGEKECPKCGSRDLIDKDEIINALQELALETDFVFIGTDPDTEGEKIAYDIACVLKPYTKEIRRVEFHEVTRKSILKAVNEFRDIDLKLVEAQIVRRIEDRWIGFQLSQKLWKEFKMRTLSAGRVQTPVLGWIIDREKKNKEKIDVTRVYIDGTYVDFRGKWEDFEIINREIIEDQINPLPPYSTDSLLRDAAKILKFSAPKTMKLAQNLFEAGLITYHRTDSVRVSDVGIEIAKEYILDKFNEKLFKARVWGEGGAHECIRPTKPIDPDELIKSLRSGEIPSKLTKDHIKLYSLIFKRFISSQMVPAKVKKAVITIKGPETKKVEGVYQIISPSFLIFNLYYLPKLDINAQIKEIKHIKVPKASLLTQADVVSLMKERKIGRPSTYAKIIATLLQRNYVIEVSKWKYLVSTRLGKMIYEYLIKNYPQLISEDRTRELEEKMDLIQEGKINYLEILRETYLEVKSIT